jgi:flagellar biosynthesis protein FliR
MPTPELGIFFRVFGFLLFAPLGFAPGRIGLRIVIALIVSLQVNASGESSYPFLNLMLGVLLAIPIAAIPAAMHGFGGLFDSIRGQNIAQIYDPMSKTNSPLFALTLEKFTWVLILATGGLEAAIKSLVSDLSFPTGVSIEWSVAAASTLKVLLEVTANIWLGLVPFGLLCLAVEGIFVLLEKLIPKSSVNAESFHVKTFIGIGMLITALSTDILTIDSTSLVESFSSNLREAING